MDIKYNKILILHYRSTDYDRYARAESGLSLTTSPLPVTDDITHIAGWSHHEGQRSAEGSMVQENFTRGSSGKQKSQVHGDHTRGSSSAFLVVPSNSDDPQDKEFRINSADSGYQSTSGSNTTPDMNYNNVVQQSDSQ